MPTKAIKQQYEEKYTIWAVYALIALGLIALILRLLFSEKIILPAGDSVWTVSIDSYIASASRGDRITLYPPWNSSHASVVSQQLQHTGMRLARPRKDSVDKPGITLVVSEDGEISFSARFDIHLTTHTRSGITSTANSLSLANREKYLQPGLDIDVHKEDISRLLSKLAHNSVNNEELVSNVFKHVRNKILKEENDASYNEISTILRDSKATQLGRARLMVALCREAGIPSRIITGFVANDEFEVSPYYWVEVFEDDEWTPYDLDKGYEKVLPANYIAMNKGGELITTSQVGNNIQNTYDIERNYDLDSLNINVKKRLIDVFNLNRFPPETRDNIALIMLLPVGVLITAFCRNIVGIRAYGTFAPTLLALSAVYADWVAALVLLAIVVSIAVSGRSAMPDKLSRIPRLGIIFTLVVLSMVIGVSVMEYFKVNPGEHVVLLPIVILSTIIDRFYSTSEENGLYIAIRRLIWTLIISLLCYPVLLFKPLGELLLTFPEAHLFTLCLILLISFYKGKKISTYPVFKWIQEKK